MDTGALWSCINYNTFAKLAKTTLRNKWVPKVVGADGSDLGSMGTVQLTLVLGDRTVQQEFIVCRQLRRNIILGVDFARRNCAGVSWTTQRTRVLSLNGIPAIEVEEDELGTPVTTAYHVKLPPRHNGIFQVQMHGEMEGNHVISPNRHLQEKHPNMYQHEIAVINNDTEHPFPLLAITNLDHVKTLHLTKGEIVGFATNERPDVTYIATVNELNIDITEDTSLKNWIPKRRQRPLKEGDEHSTPSRQKPRMSELTQGGDEYSTPPTARMSSGGRSLQSDTSTDEYGDEDSTPSTWNDINEVIESDFLISPGDIYPNRKVLLEDADITEDTKKSFEQLCEDQSEAFSKNNKDIGKTQVIEMEIDTGDSLPIAQSPYTLPLKHYDWVRQEIETLEKAGVIERSLSPWTSPVIVVPKKSAPDEPPRRRLCVDYRKVNALQQEVRRTDKSTGCLSLYPLPKIDEMFSKLGGSKVFLTIDLRSGYYHVGLTRESRPKSAFVVPMGKWQFKRTPFGLSQAPAYFQLLIDKVLTGCSEFAMGYLDDIIIFSRSEEEHLVHLEKIFRRLQEFGLKMKREKCAFFKKHIQYLGHLVSEKGFEPLPEKLEAIRKMPAPTTPKEVKQFLGLIGYYRKFVPRFSDISRPLTRLTRHDTPFEWTRQCGKAFDHLRELLMQYPILRYPDPTKGYVLYTDASGIGWSGVLTQEYADEKNKSKQHPICYVSGQFRGSQLNWAALTKEAYAIYMSIRRLSFYVTDAEVLIRCDHLPLKKFLNKQTMNAKVNNWAVELEQFKLKLDWIPGSKNLLADSLSRLMEVEPGAKQTEEPDGQEFGSYCFEELKPVEVLETVAVDEIEFQANEGDEDSTPPPRIMARDTPVKERPPLGNEGDEHSTPSSHHLQQTSMSHGIQVLEAEGDEHSTPSGRKTDVKTVQITEHEQVKEVKLPLKPHQLSHVQRNDEYCKEVARKLEKEVEMGKIFLKEEGVLYRLWIEDGRTFKCILVPQVLQESLIILAHDFSGHNGARRAYNCLKRQYYWPGIRKQVFKHCKQCAECQLQNQGQPEKQFDRFQTPDLPMQFICMDLVGPIHPQSSKGNRYVLTVIDMLTGFTIAVAIPDKNATTVCKAYRDNVYCVFGGSSRILTDNGTEFKNKEMKKICEELGVKQVFSPVYTPQSNGRLEGWHRFFKACIAKHIRGGDVEWDELVPLAVSAYNFFPCQSTKESPFLLMFRRDPMTPIAQLLEPKLRYYGEKGNFLQMDSLRRLYAVVAENIRKVREQQPQKMETPLKLKVNDLVMVKDPDGAVFEPRYQPNYRVTAIFGNNRIEVQDEKGHKSVRRSAHVKYIEPKDKITAQIPSAETLKQYGRGAKLLIKQGDIPDLQLQSGEEEEVLDINAVNTQGTLMLPLTRGGDKHSTPSRAEGSLSIRAGVLNTEGDEHSTPSRTGDGEDDTAARWMDDRTATRTNGNEGDEDSTPSTNQKSERQCETGGNGSVTKETVTGDKRLTSSQVKTSKLSWFGMKVNHLVETVACTGNRVGMGGNANITGKCKTNTQSQSEFSFFL